MAERGKRRGSRYTTKRMSNKPRSHWFRNTVLILFAGFTFVLLSYLGYLDYNIRKQFEGKRWAIPARVYANPVELYDGYNLTETKFEELLQVLHYRQDARLSSEGTYFKKGYDISVKTRNFTFWDQQQPSSLIRLNFTGSGISRITDLKEAKDIAIIRMDPVQIGSFYPTIKEDRILIKLKDAPDALIKGLLATEDRDFYQHFGISFRAIARAVWANLIAGGIVQGGSTITQQLVKNFYLTSERSLTRKVNEVFMALILEYRYSKNEILEAYLNEVYLGQDVGSAVHGFGLASEFYFGSSLKDLPLEQIASLVALVRGPSFYDPRRYPDRALQRRNLVLNEMETEGYITEKQADDAKAKPLNVIANTHRSVNRYPGFLDLVKRQLSQEYREEDLTSQGLRIFTTLDTVIQNKLEQTVAAKLNQLEKLPKAKNLEAAVVVTRRDSGEIAALASSRDNSAAGFNRALDAVRPIGSLIKPIVYLTALEYPNRYTITTPVSDTAIMVKGQNGTDWRPKNYDHKEHGNIGLHTALAHSYNLATVRIGMDVGVARTAKTLRNMGVTRAVDLFPSLFLGAVQLTPIEVTQMYQTLAGDGFSTPLKGIRAVVAADGEHLQSYPFTVKQAVDPSAAYIVNTILQEAMHEGTGRSAYSYFPRDYGLVGKTGTTNDSKDSWFAGYSGDYLSVVWVGRDDNKPAGLTGASGALQVWIPLMRQISSQPVNLIPPDNIQMAWIDPANGLLASQTCPGARQYPYIAGSAPIAYSPCAELPVSPIKSWLNDLLPNDF
ncbi:Penicillin-insensitive transglycosylase / Penicillin-sensitive transpeptidase [Candidatus Methylobacter favarea]|uniref:Penicillin-binding protein 1B n=1 Tax=Candidatus Methylobacter favarea TaxID=2707345 RepID=A0A8S0XJ81_9GAMM|nr:penicillin-binding protein 1B [Candidatus Methylobacter favarea]CAA9892973.1 Penicillin-insensitive transglycosylase / Penicillin-sensitive transpeptidase [Candidatus Methylobacter favarea]